MDQKTCPSRLRITEVSPHLICALCGGYLIDATTIVECLHSFCKTCIVRYLESSNYCPICEVLVHKTRPLQNIRLDHTLQDIVYKLVPGLFKDEMQRRREYYKNSPTIRRKRGADDKPSTQTTQRIIYSADEMFSIVLELSPNGLATKQKAKEEEKSTNGQSPDRRYLLCPAGVTVAHLRRFIHVKFSLPEFLQVEVFHQNGKLRDHYSLMDIAYIHSWRREGVLKLFYSIYKRPVEVPILPKAELPVKDTSCEITKVKEETRTSLSLTSTSTSLLSTKCTDENLPHDLSPLELIATVANDISCLEEGRSLKRKQESAELCYENDEDSRPTSASEIQIKKSIEHAIDLCSSNTNCNKETKDSCNSSQKKVQNTTASECKQPKFTSGSNTTAKSNGQTSETNSTASEKNGTPAKTNCKRSAESLPDPSNHSDEPPVKCPKLPGDHIAVALNKVQNTNEKIKVSENSLKRESQKPNADAVSEGSRDKTRDSRSTNQKSDNNHTTQMNGFCKQTEYSTTSGPNKTSKRVDQT